MLRHRQYKFGTGPGEQVSPGLRVEVFAPEQRDEVLVAEVLLIAEIFHMVGKFLPLGVVHIPGVPLIAECRHRIDAPMDKNTQFPSVIPLGCGVLGQGGPIRTVGTGGNDFFDLCQILLHMHHFLSG